MDSGELKVSVDFRYANNLLTYILSTLHLFSDKLLRFITLSQSQIQTKKLNISNLECYLSDIDPAAFESVLKLGGIELY